MKNMVVHKYIQTLENKYGDKLISKLDLNYLIQLWDIFENFDLDQLQSRDAGVGGGGGGGGQILSTILLLASPDFWTRQCDFTKAWQ